MTSPQPDKFVLISKEYFDELLKADLTGAELKFILTIIRKTWGTYDPIKKQNKKADRISNSQFQESTGLSRVS